MAPPWGKSEKEKGVSLILTRGLKGMRGKNGRFAKFRFAELDDNEIFSYQIRRKRFTQKKEKKAKSIVCIWKLDIPSSSRRIYSNLRLLDI